MTLIYPQVHLNGSNKSVLLESFINASEKVREAIVALGETAPHKRDYPQGGFEVAEAQHVDRLQRLIDTMQELQQIAEGIDQQTGRSS